jgi:hypothetical protein
MNEQPTIPDATPSQPKQPMTLGRQLWRMIFFVCETATVCAMLAAYLPYNRIIFDDPLSLAPLLALPFASVAMFVLRYKLLGITGIATVLFATFAVPAATSACK